MGIFKFSDPMYMGSNIIVHQIQNFPYLLYIKLHLKMPGNEQLQISSPPILGFVEFWLSGQTIQQCWFVLRFCAFPCLFVFHYPECLFKACRSPLRGSNCAKLGKSYLQTWNEIIQRKRIFVFPFL